MPIEHVSFAVPQNVETFEDIAHMTGADPEFVRTKVGVEKRHILAPGQSGVSLSVEAVTRLFGETDLSAEQVDLIVCVTQTPDRRIPHNAPQIAQGLALAPSVASFDISLGCSGYAYALSIVEGFLMSTGMRNAVLVTCDPYSRIMAKEDKDTNAIFGDAATATWIAADGQRSQVLATDFGTDGAGGDAIAIAAGGADLPLVSLSGTDGVDASDRDNHRLLMKGRDVFNFVMVRIPQSIETCLKKAALDKSEIDWFVLHQGSRYMLESMARRAGLDMDRVVININAYGNTVSSTLPIILSELDNTDELAGKTVLLSGFGVGLSWASTIIKFS